MFKPPLQVLLTEHNGFDVNTIQHAIGWYETCVFYSDGFSKVVANEAVNEHDAILNHRIIAQKIEQRDK